MQRSKPQCLSWNLACRTDSLLNNLTPGPLKYFPFPLKNSLVKTAHYPEGIESQKFKRPHLNVLVLIWGAFLHFVHGINRSVECCISEKLIYLLLSCAPACSIKVLPTIFAIQSSLFYRFTVSCVQNHRQFQMDRWSVTRSRLTKGG